MAKETSSEGYPPSCSKCKCTIWNGTAVAFEDPAAVAAWLRYKDSPADPAAVDEWRRYNEPPEDPLVRRYSMSRETFLGRAIRQRGYFNRAAFADRAVIAEWDRRMERDGFLPSPEGCDLLRCENCDQIHDRNSLVWK